MAAQCLLLQVHDYTVSLGSAGIAESKLDRLFDQIEDKPSLPSIQEFKLIKHQKKKNQEYLLSLTFFVSLVGALTSILFGYIKNPSLIISANPEWILSGVGVFVISILMLSFSSILRKQKEEDLSTNKSSAFISAASFEVEVAKTIKKAGIQYEVEPKIGKFSPDFLIEKNNKKIAIEVKAWENSIPPSLIRRAIDSLNSLSKEEGIDEVILVIKKPIIKEDIISGQANIKVYTLSEFNNFLKN